MQGLQMIEVAPDQILPSPFNHRQKFTGIDELGASLLEKGMISPITVRPNPVTEDEERYELVVGERRWRASKKVKLSAIPVIVRELSDQEVIEVQLVENVQRVDVHPMEEAEGYSVLLDKYGYDVDAIVSKTGKSRTAVYNRLKLLKLCATARKAFLDDKFVASIAEMIARIPSRELQEQATADIVKGRREEKWSLDEGDDLARKEGIAAEDHEVLPLSFREAQLLLQRRYMLRLALAPFDVADTTLSPGSCTGCTYRTGNQPDLFGDVANADVCTNPPCWDAKKTADWDRKAAEAEAAGKVILPDDRAAEIFHGDRLSWNAGYLDLKAEADEEFQPEKKGKDKRRTWMQVLGKDVPTPVLARDGGGAARELVDKTAAMAVLRDAGKLPAHLDRETSDAATKAAQKRAQEVIKIRRVAASFAIAKCAGEVFAMAKHWRWLAEAVIRQASMESHQATCERREIEPVKGKESGGGRHGREEALLKLAGNLDSDELQGLVIELLAWESAVLVHVKGWGANLETGAKVFGVDLGKVHAKAVADFKGAKAEKPSPKKTKKGA